MNFKLHSEYKPAGDQPKAIEQLVAGLEAGHNAQTLLGVTGSGKSVVANTPVIIRDKHGQKVVSIGSFVDDCLDTYQNRVKFVGDTEILDTKFLNIETYSIDITTGKAKWKPLKEVTRHRSPEMLFHVSTMCGRSLIVTGDHNFYILRNGKIHLTVTHDIQNTDYIPVPRSITSSTFNTPLEVVTLADVLDDQTQKFYIHPGFGQRWNPLMLRNLPYQKRYRVSRFDEPITLNQYNDHNAVCEKNLSDMTVCLKNGFHIQVEQKLTHSFLRFLGYYIAEGHAESRYIILSSGDESIIQDFTKEALLRGMTIHHRSNTYDYQFGGSIWSTVLKKWCGSHSSTKKMPPFWMNLSNEQLAQMLSGYFSGDGGVEKAVVSASTISEQLASDILYALLRFGIVARLKRRLVKIPNSDRRREVWRIVISGQDNLLRFADQIGFFLDRKQKSLLSIIRSSANTNVDLIPFSGSQLKEIREHLGLSQKYIAQAIGIERSYISMIEHGRRLPSYTVSQNLVDFFNKFKDPKVEKIVSYWQAMLGAVWSPVSSVKQVSGERYVYDFSVPGFETFLAGRGGLFVHNTFTMANVIEKTQRPTLVIAHNKTLAAQLCNEFREFFPENAVEYFVSYYDYYQPEAYMPRTDTYIEKEAMINEEIDRLRHAATQALLTRRDVIVVASVSCIYNLGSPEEYQKTVMHVGIGKREEARGREEIIRQLIEMQFERTNADLTRGHFRAHGDVIEIMPMNEETLYRLMMDGDEIISIQRLDPITRKLIESLQDVWIFPAKHYVASSDRQKDSLRAIRQELKDRLEELEKSGGILEAERLSRRTRYDLEMIEQIGYCNGIENYSRYFDGRAPGEAPQTLIDYFPRDFLTMIDESHVSVPQIYGMYNGDQARKKTLIEHGFRLPSALDNRPLQFSEFEQKIGQVIFTTATPGPYEKKVSQKVVEQIIRPTGLVDPQMSVRPVTPTDTQEGQVEDLIREIEKRAAKKERVLVTTLTKKMAEDLTEFLKEKKINVQYLHSDVDTLDRITILTDLRKGDYDVLVGVNLLREGLDLPEVTLVAILDADKEGFLRSETSIIQTIGRAARNVDGEVILYADEMTGSLKRAIKETERRRNIQLAYNTAHGITPKTVKKQIGDIRRMLGGDEKTDIKNVLALELTADPHEIQEVIEEKEYEMRQAAQKLDFETAAILRDEIAILKKELKKK